MSRKPVVCLAGTLDTKGTEYAFVRDALVAAGVDVLVVDCGVLGEPFFTPDIASAEVAERAGITSPTSPPVSRAAPVGEHGDHQDERGPAGGPRGPVRAGPDRRGARAWAAPAAPTCSAGR